MKILAIDTSCDETSVAISEDDRVLANEVSSQIEFHKKWGGVVPDIAKRMHQEFINSTLETALKKAKTKPEDIDVFAVTHGPGLAIALGVGIDKAKELANKYKKPLVAVNHMEGHIYSALTKNSKGKPEIEYSLPLLAILVSGGHTEIVLMKNHGEYEILGRTLDDAMGEAFDKVARMLEVGYPGGPMVEMLAKKGNPERFPLPIPMAKIKTADMSYSGLKTASLYLTRKVFTPEMDKKEKAQTICDIAASFQKSAIDALLLKTEVALNNLVTKGIVKNIILAGGVSANLALRQAFRKKFGKNYRIHFPTGKKLYGDNAGMIAVAAYHNALRKNFADIEKVERSPNLSL